MKSWMEVMTMLNKYYITFTGWIAVNASTPEQAYDIAKRTLADAGASMMIEDIEEEQY
jgi:hypothetical protein